MTLRHLKIFVAVCQTGSTIAAGEKLHIAQPSISLAISELEDYYGIKLFDRIAKRLQITESGRHFLQYATHIVALFDDMEKEVKNFDAKGILRVGASISIGNYLLPQKIVEFNKAHADMAVKVTINNSENIQQDVLNNKIDIGLIEGIVHSPYLAAYKFHEDELIFICSNHHPFAQQRNIELPSLQHQSLILREVGSAGRELFDSLITTHGLGITPAWESISTQAILRAVQANLGVSVLPYLLVKDALDRKGVSQFHIQDICLIRNFSLIYHCNKFLTKSATDFISLWLKENTPSN
ncbi:MAG: LysR family transcriptional regulator [Angelakisella sp.]|nr:LysR family transcriptional regulator [Angelakisella sp.]